MDEASHQCEFVHETILVELLSHSLQGRGSSPVSLFIEKNIPIPKLFVTCFAWMRFLTSVSLLMRQYYLNFLSHSLQGWGSSPVSLFIEKDFPIPKLLVTFFARMKFLISMFVHEKTLPKLLVTFCAMMRFLTKLSLFIEKYFPIPKLLVACFAWMRLLSNLCLLMRKIT